MLLLLRCSLLWCCNLLLLPKCRVHQLLLLLCCHVCCHVLAEGKVLHRWVLTCETSTCSNHQQHAQAPVLAAAVSTQYLVALRSCWVQHVDNAIYMTPLDCGRLPVSPKTGGGMAI
jgi:hypothetical protein